MKIFSAIPLNPPEGALTEEVLFTGMLGGLRGRVPCREMMGFIDATIVSRDRLGLGSAGELGL
jgi:hypothetical protein